MLELPKTIRLTPTQRAELDTIISDRDVAYGVMDVFVLELGWPDNDITQEVCDVATAYVQRQLAEERVLVIMSVVQYHVWRWIIEAAKDDSNTAISHQMRAAFDKLYNLYFGEEP